MNKQETINKNICLGKTISQNLKVIVVSSKDTFRHLAKKLQKDYRR